MPKKKTNVTISDGIMRRAEDLMKVRDFASVSALLEGLIREKHEEIFGVDAKRISIDPSATADIEPKE